MPEVKPTETHKIIIFKLLKELGGRAASDEIRELAKERYPHSTLSSYATQYLQRLSREGYVRQLSDGNWTIENEVASKEMSDEELKRRIILLLKKGRTLERDMRVVLHLTF